MAKKKSGEQPGNQNAIGNDGGRPPLYSNPKEMESKINEYFDQFKLFKPEIEKDTTIAYPTITGLVIHLGFVDRVSFYDCLKRPEFSYILKKARTKIEFVYENKLHGQQPTGSIFALKNMGWDDKKKIEHDTPQDSVIELTIKGKGKKKLK